MIDRDEVLHVARLARLQLSDDEVSRISGELSKILDHVATISELDLADVPITAHVVDVDNALRDDVPHDSLPHEVALDQAPDVADGGFRVPSPQA